MLVLMLICSIVYPQKPEMLNKPTSTVGDPIRAYLNLNNISTIFKNDGISDIDYYESNSGFTFPKGTGKTAVFIVRFIMGC